MKCPECDAFIGIIEQEEDDIFSETVLCEVEGKVYKEKAEGGEIKKCPKDN